LDAVGRRIGQTDPLGRTQLFNRDKNGRLVAVQTPLNTTASQTFDQDGNRTAIANPVGAATTFTYDLGGRMTMMSSPMGRETSYGYDRRGLLASLTKPSGQQATFTYDPAGRVTQWVDPVGTINYGYDNKGRVLTVSENGKTILRAYDALDRITRYVDIFSNEIQYAYDAVGNLTNLTYPGGNQVRYSYDAANRMQSLTDWTGRTTSFAYDTNGLLAQIARPNGTLEVCSYDSSQRLNMLAELNASGSATSQTVLTWDAAGQLVGEAVTPNPVFVMPAQANMTYDLDDRLTSWNGQTVASDADGNSITAPLAQGIQPLSFDARNRLTSTPTQSFEYDPEGLRVLVSEAGITNWFVNNPNTRLSEMLMKTSSTGVTDYYIYGASGLLYALEGTSAKYYRYDTRDNTVATMDDTGATIAQYAYSPYGQVQSQPTGTSDLFMFAGRSGVQTDSSGLLYMRARYYSPYSMRFVSQDPILGQINTVASLNRFNYANGSPIKYYDPLGLCTESNGSNNGNNNLGQALQNTGQGFSTLGGALDWAAEIAEEVAPEYPEIAETLGGLGNASDWIGNVSQFIGTTLSRHNNVISIDGNGDLPGPLDGPFKRNKK
jgi:RHS repeat-associated protein